MNFRDANQGRAVEAYRITCSGKAVQVAPDGIAHLGNTLDRWVMARAMVVQHWEQGPAACYVLDEQTGQRSFVGCARDEGIRPSVFSHFAGQCNTHRGAFEAMSKGPPWPA